MLCDMDFPHILKSSIQKRGYSYSEFAEKVGVSHGLPGSIISKPRRKTPTHIPDGDVEKWADALHLKDGARVEFLAASAVHYASEDQKKVFRYLKDRIHYLMRKLAVAHKGLTEDQANAPGPHQSQLLQLKILPSNGRFQTQDPLDPDPLP